MDRWKFVVLGTLTALVLTGRATAQERYPLHEMNFDMWCQEQKHLPPARCDRRLPGDDADFQAYRATIEKYEIPYLQKKNDEQNLNRVITRDPLDNPTRPSTPQNPAASIAPTAGASPQ